MVGGAVVGGAVVGGAVVGCAVVGGAVVGDAVTVVTVYGHMCLHVCANVPGHGHGHVPGCAPPHAIRLFQSHSGHNHYPSAAFHSSMHMHTQVDTYMSVHMSTHMSALLYEPRNEARVMSPIVVAKSKMRPPCEHKPRIACKVIARYTVLLGAPMD